MCDLNSNKIEYVASREFAKKCDFKNSLLQSSSPAIDPNIFELLTNGSSVYICNTAIPTFIEYYLNKLTVRIVLVSGDSDDTISLTSENNKIISSPMIIHWYAQNCVINHPKVTRLPIGLDYHTIANGGMPGWGSKICEYTQEKEIKRLIKDSKPFYDRKIKCYANYHFQIHRGDRMDAYNNVPKNLVDYEETPVLRLTTLEKQLEYAFVISPFGGGLDCHRTWEALILGCIPIIVHSDLDPLFEDLPVLLVDRWSDVNEDLLVKTVLSFQSRTFNLDKLKLNYWTNKINYSHAECYKYKVALVGCTKNSETTVIENLNKLVEIGSLFYEYKIFIYENDSSDNTVLQLQQFKDLNDNFDFVHEIGINEQYQNVRTNVLAHGRNLLFDKVDPSYDYMIKIDLDGLLVGFNPKSIYEVFNYNVNDWDVMTANCTGRYYDIWALRVSEDVWKQDVHGLIWDKPINHDCWYHQNHMPPREYIKTYQRIIPVNSPLIETDSSFGGLAIYKRSKLENCMYCGAVYNDWGNFLHPHCEHVSFNNGIKKNGGRIFICPSLLVKCQTEHLN
jgi:hypothetical protein